MDCSESTLEEQLALAKVELRVAESRVQELREKVQFLETVLRAPGPRDVALAMEQETRVLERMVETLSVAAACEAVSIRRESDDEDDDAGCWLDNDVEAVRRLT